MKNYLYDVVFNLEHIEIYAGNPIDAAILAVAKRIEAGRSTTIDQIYDVEREEPVTLFPCCLVLVEENN